MHCLWSAGLVRAAPPAALTPTASQNLPHLFPDKPLPSPPPILCRLPALSVISPPHIPAPFTSLRPPSSPPPHLPTSTLLISLPVTSSIHPPLLAPPPSSPLRRGLVSGIEPFHHQPFTPALHSAHKRLVQRNRRARNRGLLLSRTWLRGGEVDVCIACELHLPWRLEEGLVEQRSPANEDADRGRRKGGRIGSRGKEVRLWEVMGGEGRGGEGRGGHERGGEVTDEWMDGGKPAPPGLKGL